MLEAEMLDDEHNTLWQIEEEVAAADPAFAALLRNGQRRLPYRRRKLMWHGLITLLVLLTCVLLMLGLPSSALAVGTLAAGVWWLRRWPIRQQG